ncbi:MAG: hypothetical protein R3C59_22365 [Planctomycetaceae bacterium]
MAKSSSKKKTKKTMAQKADKFVCYQKSVQAPDHEMDIFDQVFKEAYGRRPMTLREDFCGTFAVCCEWVKTHKERTAWAVDLCAETLQWGKDHNQKKLKPHQAERITILEQDVRDGNTPKVDLLAAQNFSFWIFRTRQEVIDYFKVAHSNLKNEGVMVMDMMGGPACYDTTCTDKRTIEKGRKGFKYHWQQASFNPVNADASFYIHFKFGDGSMMKRAFEYHWRFWTVPEVREMLAEAGFRESRVYFEKEDEDGEDTGEWEQVEEAPNNDSWLCYVVGVK